MCTTFIPSPVVANLIKSGAAASRNPKAALAATPDLIKFATTGEGIKVVHKGIKVVPLPLCTTFIPSSVV